MVDLILLLKEIQVYNNDVAACVLVPQTNIINVVFNMKHYNNKSLMNLCNQFKDQGMEIVVLYHVENIAMSM